MWDGGGGGGGVEFNNSIYVDLGICGKRVHGETDGFNPVQHRL